jgi:hypothetical protein
MAEKPDFAKKEFLFRLSRSEYEKEWGKDYSKPSFGTRLASSLLRYMPKIGPFKAMAFNNPNPADRRSVLQASIAASTSTASIPASSWRLIATGQRGFRHCQSNQGSRISFDRRNLRKALEPADAAKFRWHHSRAARQYPHRKQNTNVSASEQNNHFDSLKMGFARNRSEMVSRCGTSAIHTVDL